MNHALIEMIERIGFVNDKGKRVYGSAAVIHFLYMLHTPYSVIERELRRYDVDKIEGFIRKRLCA